MFSQFAPWYDLHYRAIKNYAAEAERIAYLLERLGTKGKRVLDVACGTGEHARALSEEHGYQVDGVDFNPDLIVLAQQKNPSGDFTAADMRSFSLPCQYDAITCLFSSIGYVETLEGLAAAIRSMAAHLKPGGWLIIEPWAQPSEWTYGMIDATESQDPEGQISILQTRLGTTEGSVSVLNIDYRIETPDETLEFSETHRLGLFTREEIENALSEAGFQSQYLPPGVLDGALHVACYTP